MNAYFQIVPYRNTYGHVRFRAYFCRIFQGAWKKSADAKVTKFYTAMYVDENIWRFDVTMHNLEVLEIMKSGDRLNTYTKLGTVTH